MRRFSQVTLWGLIEGFLALPALAAESRGFELSVLLDGYRVSEYPWQGRTYVEALRSRSFTLRVSNPTGERVAVAIDRHGGKNLTGSNVHSAALGFTTGVASDLPPWTDRFACRLRDMIITST